MHELKLWARTSAIAIFAMVAAACGSSGKKTSSGTNDKATGQTPSGGTP